MRTYLCVDCPPGRAEHTTPGDTGRMPQRCPEHRHARRMRRQRLRRSGLAAVPDVAVPEEPIPAPMPDVRHPTSGDGPVRAALRQDLSAVFSKHPAARTLERVADVLALVLDSPAVAIDPRVIPPLSRELRAIVQELTTHEEAGEDDLFGGAGPVVVGG